MGSLRFFSSFVGGKTKKKLQNITFFTFLARVEALFNGKTIFPEIPGSHESKTTKNFYIASKMKELDQF